MKLYYLESSDFCDLALLSISVYSSLGEFSNVGYRVPSVFENAYFLLD